MTVPEQRDNGQSEGPKTARRGLTRTGLSPTVERMFGALVDRCDEMASDLPSDAEAPPVSRPGAA